MAYVHNTAAATTDRLYIKPFRFFTPRNFLDFIDLFKNLTYKITKEEKVGHFTDLICLKALVNIVQF